MKKRSFVMGACSAALSTGLLSPAGAVPRGATTLPGAARLDLPPLGDAPGRDDWNAYLQQPFVLAAGGRQWPVVLDRISDVDAAGGHTQFVLGFSSAAAVPAGLYRIEHASGQSLMIGLSAAGRDDAAQARLRAEFSLLPA